MNPFTQFWSQRNKSERAMLAVCAIVVIIGVPLALTPPSKAGKKLLPAAQARSKRLAMGAEIMTMNRDTDQLGPQIQSMVYADTPEAVIPKVVRTLQGYASQSGIHLREIKPLRAKRLAGVTRVPLSVRFTSPFDKTVPFLYRVEDPQGKMVVDKYTVTASDPKTRMVDVDVELSLFTQGQGAEASGSTASGG